MHIFRMGILAGGLLAVLATAAAAAPVSFFYEARIRDNGIIGGVPVAIQGGTIIDIELRFDPDTLTMGPSNDVQGTYDGAELFFGFADGSTIHETGVRIYVFNDLPQDATRDYFEFDGCRPSRCPNGASFTGALAALDPALYRASSNLFRDDTASVFTSVDLPTVPVDPNDFTSAVGSINWDLDEDNLFETRIIYDFLFVTAGSGGDVPAPAGLPLLAGALALLGWARRRRAGR